MTIMAHSLLIASPFVLRTHVCAHRAYKTTLNLNLLIHTKSTRYNRYVQKGTADRYSNRYKTAIGTLCHYTVPLYCATTL